MIDRDTIAAIATASGKGSVGIVRISGSNALAIGEKICKRKLPPRAAIFCTFANNNDDIDQGIALYFAAPASFTGEDVVELQGHGGPVVLNLLLGTVLQQGARMARPGEFSERAFLNDRIDLAQAEAIADLIDSSSIQAARNAMHSLQGQFSRAIDELAEKLVHLRMYVEAAIDFPEEEIDFFADGHVASQLEHIGIELQTILRNARQGAALREGIKVVIAGKPNAGKSSLLNALSGRDSAIVTNIAGTTRDILREIVLIDGLPLHIIDTAGLRDSTDPVEQEGIRRAWLEINQADVVLLVVDSTQQQASHPDQLWQELCSHSRPTCRTILINNKIDQSGLAPGLYGAGNHNPEPSFTAIGISAKNGEGIQDLQDLLKKVAGLENTGEGIFSARSRHLDALQRAQQLLTETNIHFLHSGAGELLAEDLRLIHQYLGEITGQFSPDELLGKIFSSFCIGK